MANTFFVKIQIKQVYISCVILYNEIQISSALSGVFPGRLFAHVTHPSVYPCVRLTMLHSLVTYNTDNPGLTGSTNEYHNSKSALTAKPCCDPTQSSGTESVWCFAPGFRDMSVTPCVGRE